MPWGFAAAAIGSIGGALIGSSASKSAAKTQANAANQASQTQLDMFKQIQANEAPYMGAGTNALTALQSGLGLGPGGTGTGSLNAPFTLADFQKSPGYDFQMQQGIDAIQNSAAARGGVFSGNTLKALQTFGTGLANQDYWNAYNAYVNSQNQRFGQLQTLAGSGQNAAANLGALGTQTASSVGQNIIGGANAISAGQIASGNALNTGLQNAGQNFLLAQLMNPGMFSSQPAQVPFQAVDFAA